MAWVSTAFAVQARLLIFAAIIAIAFVNVDATKGTTPCIACKRYKILEYSFKSRFIVQFGNHRIG